MKKVWGERSGSVFCHWATDAAGNPSSFYCRVSNIVEEGRVEYVPVRVPSFVSPGPSNLRVSSGKSKMRTISRSSVKRHFEIASPPPATQQHRIVEDLSFSAALDRQQSCKQSLRSERKRRAAPVFQSGLP